MPRLVVLMPTRNALPFLRLAVGSTLRALPADAALHVLVDGGTDRSAEWLLERRHARLKVIVSPVSNGVASSLNRLLDSSDSEFVARMDADDVCLPWRFRHQSRTLGTSHLCFSPVVFVNERLLPVKMDLPLTVTGPALAAHLMLGNVLVHPTMFARRAALEALHGYRGIKAEDYDLWLRALASDHRIRRSSVPVLLYRTHPGQLSRQSVYREEDRDADRLNASYAAVFRRLFGQAPLDADMLRVAASAGDFSQVTAVDRALLVHAIERLPLRRLERLLVLGRARRLLRET